MKTIKLTDQEHEIISKILGNLSDQIDGEITNLVPADVSDEEADQILDEARDAFAKIF